MPPAADNTPIGPAALRCVLWHPSGAALPADLLNSLSKRIGHITVCTDAFAALAEVCVTHRDAWRSPTDPAPSPGSRPSTVLLLVHPPQLGDLAETLAEIRTFAPETLCWKYDASANPKLSAVVESDVSAWMARGAGSASAAAGVESLSTARTTNHGDQRALSSISSPFTPVSTPQRAPSPPAIQPNAEPAPQRPAAAAPSLRLTGVDGHDQPLQKPEIVVRPQPRVGGLRLRGEPPQDADQSSNPPQRPRPLLTAEEMRMLLGDDPIDGPPANQRNGHHPGPESDGSGGKAGGAAT